MRAAFGRSATALMLLLLAGSHGLNASETRDASPIVVNGQTHGPRDLPYYDLCWAKSLTLAAMNAKIISLDSAGDNEILTLQYDAFDQPIATDTGVKVVRWRQRGWLILPKASLRGGKAVAINIHNDAAGDKANPKSFLGRGVAVATAFGIPVLIHGWAPDVVEAIDGRGFHDTQVFAMRRLLAAKITDAKSLPMDGRYLFNGNPLAKADMVSLSLLQRMVEKERGVQVTQIGSMGISKEGAAHWILGAVDDRVTVLGAGGYYAHDSGETYDHYGRDTGWKFPWKGGDRPEYDGLRQLFSAFWEFLDWSRSTEAGRLVARTTTDPANWYSQIRAKHVLVFGDLGFMPGQHDGPWPFWAENGPLSRFHHKSWRYIRAFDGSGVMLDQDGIGEMGMSLLPELADTLVSDRNFPATPKVTLEKLLGRRVIVRAKSEMTPSAARNEALLLYAISPERGLRDAESWHVAPMMRTADGGWSLTTPNVPEGQGLTAIVVVREKVVIGDLSYWRSASSLPIEVFAVPEFKISGPRWDDR